MQKPKSFNKLQEQYPGAVLLFLFTINGYYAAFEDDAAQINSICGTIIAGMEQHNDAITLPGSALDAVLKSLLAYRIRVAIANY